MPKTLEADDSPESAARQPSSSGLEYLNRLPWERIVTWALVLVVLYLLRDFFLVIFATFLICYFAQRINGQVLKRIPEPKQTVGVQRTIVVAIFVAFILVFAGLVWAICPELFRQGQAVLQRVETTNIQAESDKILDRTVGSFLFHRQFSSNNQTDVQKAIDTHKASGNFGKGWWQAWPSIQTGLKAEEVSFALPVNVSQENEATIRKATAFKQYTAQNRDVALDFDEFKNWNEAYSKGEPSFVDSVHKLIASAGEAKSQSLTEHDFELFTQSKLAQDWLVNDPVASSIRHYTEEHKPELISDLGLWTQRLILTVFSIPLHIGMAFLIAFLICFDAPNIFSRVRDMRNTRVRSYYDQIAPMMSQFGSLTGKAIEAQLVIGIVNTILSIIVLMILGVDNIYFLAAIVFVSSIVPVVGAVFAVAVVCLMATMQPDGSLTLAIQSGVAIALIHGFTSLIVSPRIYGKSFHLPPVLVMVILILAEHFFGMWGLVLGVPVAVYLMQVILRGNKNNEPE